MAEKLSGKDNRVFTILGDGELNEGQCWEAFQFMAHNKLNHCIVFVDNNKRQHDGYCTEVLNPFSYEEKMRAFGFWAITVDGASEEAIDDAINLAKTVPDKAICIILDTVKGTGVSYMTNSVAWHGKGPNDEEYQVAMNELNAAYAALEQEEN